MLDLVHFGPECPICFGLGRVCENHPKRACSEELGCQCGAGMPCECVSADGLDDPDISQVLEVPTIKHWRPARSSDVARYPFLPMGKAGSSLP
jgi:hypothetical protein